MLIGVLSAAWFIVRAGGGAALDTMVTANHILAERVKELEASDKIKTNEIAILTARTNIALALAPLQDWAFSHDKMTKEFHDSSLRLLEMIAKRLGPDQHDGD